MSDTIYNEAIIAEAKAKVGAGELPDPDVRLRRDNPLCGDRVTLDLGLEDGHVASVAHKTRGCLLTQAAASILARHAVGADLEQARKVKGEIEALLAGRDGTPSWPELAMFEPVRPSAAATNACFFPSRPWRRRLPGRPGRAEDRPLAGPRHLAAAASRDPGLSGRCAVRGIDWTARIGEGRRSMSAPSR